MVMGKHKKGGKGQNDGEYYITCFSYNTVKLILFL